MFSIRGTLMPSRWYTTYTARMHNTAQKQMGSQQLWLRSSSRVHHYSAANILLLSGIIQYCPEASPSRLSKLYITDVLTGSCQVVLLLWMEYDSSKQAPPSTSSKTCCQDYLEAVNGTTLRSSTHLFLSPDSFCNRPIHNKTCSTTARCACC